MKYLVILLMLPLLSSTECSPKHKLPACLTNMLDERIKGEARDAPLEVTEYEYNGKRVFLFTMPCCDQFNDLYDYDCNRICAPSGGITGKGDGKCPDFNEKATKRSVVWTKPQK